MVPHVIILVTLALVLIQLGCSAGVEVGQAGGRTPGRSKGQGHPGRRKHLPPACNLTTFTLSKPDGTWYLQSDGTFKFAAQKCRLRQFTSKMTRKCLAGEHIVFLGDSLSRYFYLSLATILAKGKWGQKFSRYQGFDNQERSILTEKDFMLSEEDKKRPWSAFYEASSAALNSIDAMEVCDCFRDDHLPFYNDTGRHQQQSCFENRHFRMTPNHDLDDIENDVRLSYIQWYGGMPMRGYKELSHLPRDSSVTSYLKEKSKKYCPALAGGEETEATLVPYSAKCANYRSKNINGDYPSFFEKDKCTGWPDDNTTCLQFEREVLGPMNVTSLVANIGWHSPIWEPKEQAKRFVEKLVTTGKTMFTSRSEKTNLPAFMWRSSNSPAPFHDPTDEIVAAFAKYQDRRVMDYFDIWTLTEPLNALQKALNKNNENGVKGAFAKYRMQVARRAKDRTISLDIPNIMVDHAHYEPWVYAELNNIYLNAVCPP